MRSFTLVVLLGSATASLADSQKEKSLQQRTFLFTYRAEVAAEPGEKVRLWLPVPSSSADQTVEIVEQVATTAAKIHTEPKFGNRILYDEVTANEKGAVVVRMAYRVTRKEVRSDSEGDVSREEAEKFLKPDEKVPATGKYLKLIEKRMLPQGDLKVGRILYDLVNAELRYSKEGTGWGQGDVEWACDSKYGNCSDFHSLFIGLVRSQKMPGRFEIGFPLPQKRGQGEIAGYHCWAKFRPAGHGWVPVDISEANKNPAMADYYFGNLTEDRVAFSVGRDLMLVPKQDGPPVNFLVYPYAEIAGKPVAADKIKKRFGFEDVK